MRIFILEDSPERIVAFTSIGGHDFTVAKTCEKAKAKFAPPYDLILLDHDLADEHYGSDDSAQQGTGTEFAQWLTGQENDCPIIVHSYNPDGARRMVDILREGGWSVLSMPFGTGLLSYLEQTRKQSPER